MASFPCENALWHNLTSLSGLTQVAGIPRIKKNYPKVCWRGVTCPDIIPFPIPSTILLSLYPRTLADCWLGRGILSARAVAAGGERRGVVCASWVPSVPPSFLSNAHARSQATAT